MEQITTKHNTPKDVFLHLLNILTFYLSIIGFINLYIHYIGVLFPDPLNFYYTAAANSVRIFTSILVIAVPVFILTAWLLGKDLKSNPGKRELKLRKWLTYLTLFVSAVTMIVDLIVVVNSFLSGELTTRFLLKVLVVLVTAAAVFGYYIWDLRRKDQETSKTPKMLAWAVAFLVAASVIAGFFIVGTPAQQRAMRFDEQRLSDLQVLQSQIVNYWVQKTNLPADLKLLEDSISGYLVPQDPETKTPYEYRMLTPLSFELCATFKTSTKDSGSNLKGSRSVYIAPLPAGSFQQNWNHESVRTCFERTIDPQLYKPKPLQ